MVRNQKSTEKMPIKKILILVLASFTLHLSAQKPPETIEEYETSYNQRIQQEYLHQVYIPEDLTDAFLQLNKLVEKPSKEKFKSIPEDIAAKKLHFSLGRWIIHNWGFYGGSRLSHHIKSLGLHHPDDMARLIIITYHRSINRKSLNVKALIEKLKAERKKIEEEKAKEGVIIHQEKRIRPKDGIESND